MIVAYAGRRAGSLPDGAEEWVAPRIRRLLAGLNPSAVVGAASDGGDLLVLEAALERDIEPRVVLPTARPTFREASVEEGWRDRFDRSVDRAAELGTVESLELEDGSEAYTAGNARFVELAEELCGDAERAVVLVVATSGEGEMVEDLAERARLRGMPLLRIDPATDIATRPACFVAMPYGAKYDPQRKITIDCNLLYERVLVPALENAQLRYRRADEEIDAGVILQPMIERIADADLVIGDLATGNFNVGWELGLRHLLRPWHTLLTLPAGTTPPFDVAPVRMVMYEYGESGLSDDAVVAAWSALAPYLERVARGEEPDASDSPVAAVMEVDRWAAVTPRTARDERWEQLRARLALARDMRDGASMVRLADGAEGLDSTQRRLVAAEAGVGLVRLGDYANGARLLHDVVQADPEGRRPEAHVHYAQALYKPDEASLDDLTDARDVLADLLARRPDHPELWAGLGAIHKRRSRRTSGDERRAEIAAALDAYARDYERDLDAFYEGINLVACGLLLAIAYDDAGAGDRARRALPAVALAAELALSRQPGDFWAAVTVAEARLHEALLGLSTTPEAAVAAYRAAGAMRPEPGAIDSSLTQLRWLIEQGVEEPWLPKAGREFAAAAGSPERASDLSEA